MEGTKIETEKIIYIDENDFIKKYRSLKKYCPKAHKYLMFNILSKHHFDKQNGKHIQELPASKEFKAVYGPIKLIYSCQNDVIAIENIEPSSFLLDGYRRDLETYKGVPYRNAKDKFKITLVMKRKEQM